MAAPWPRPLDARDIVVLALRDDRKLYYREIARLLGISVTRAQQLYGNARRRLQREYDQQNTATRST